MNAPIRIAAVSAMLALAACKGEPAPAPVVEAPPAPPPAPIEVKGKRVDVTASADGFQPNAITVTKGEATTLVCTRTTNETCATEVVFPELKLEKKLPLNQPVAIEVPADESRTLAFHCGMKMYKSMVVVE